MKPTADQLLRIELLAVVILEVVMFRLLARPFVAAWGWVAFGVAIGFAASLPTTLALIYLLRRERDH